MEQTTIWSKDVLKAIDESRREHQELETSKEFYDKLYKLMYR